MTFWDYANNHSVDAVLVVLFAAVAWISCATVNLAQVRRKRDALPARESTQTFPRTGAGGQAS